MRVRSSALALALVLVATAAAAEPITIVPGTVNHFRANVAPNDVGQGDGDRARMGADVIPSAGTVLTAVQGVTVTSNCQPLAVSPSFCAISTLFSPARLGPWSLTFRNGTDTATIVTPSLAGAESPVPFPTGVTASGSSLTPTFTFSVPPTFTPDAVRINIFDRAVTLPTGLKDVVHSQTVPATTRSFTVPATLSSGQPLRINNPYTVEISLVETRGHVELTTGNAPILRRSHAFFDFVPVDDVPGGVTLPPSLPPTNFTPAFFESQLAGLNDTFLAQGGQPLTPADCPSGLCAGPFGPQTSNSYLFDLLYAEPRLRDVREGADTLVLRTHLPNCPPGPVGPGAPCFDLTAFDSRRADLQRAQNEVVTNASVRAVIAAAAEGSRFSGSTILQRPEKAVQEAIRGFFLNRVFAFTSAELTDAQKAQISTLARLAPPAVTLPSQFTITYSPVTTIQAGLVVGTRGVETPLGTFAAFGFGAVATLDPAFLQFMQLQVGHRTQAYFGVLATGFALMEAEVTRLANSQVELTFRGIAPAAFAQTEEMSVQVALNGSAFRPGETLTLSVDARNPPGNVEADLYVGAILPDGRTALFFTAPGVPGTPVSLTSASRFPRMQAAPLGYTLSAPTFFQFTFPATGIAPGRYQVFAALIRPGALADDRVDPADILAFDIKPIVFGP